MLRDFRQELARVFEHRDRLLVGVAARRIVGREHEVSDGTLVLVAFLEMQRYLGRHLWFHR